MYVTKEMSSKVVYAIVKAGGRQEKVSVGDVVVVDKLAAEVGDTVDFKPVMVVDGDQVTSDAADLEKIKVTAEVLEQTKLPEGSDSEVQEQDRIYSPDGPPR